MKNYVNVELDSINNNTKKTQSIFDKPNMVCSIIST